MVIVSRVLILSIILITVSIIFGLIWYIANLFLARNLTSDFASAYLYEMSIFECCLLVLAIDLIIYIVYKTFSFIFFVLLKERTNKLRRIYISLIATLLVLYLISASSMGFRLSPYVIKNILVVIFSIMSIVYFDDRFILRKLNAVV